MADTPNPLAGLPPDQPAVSMQTIAITGILVDVYGLAELPPNRTHISVLWLHNPRLGDRARMAPMAKRVVDEYNKVRAGGSTRGLIAAAFDQRNHGSREVHHLANLAWNNSNPTHAQDMFGITTGTVLDTQLLITALPGYLFLDDLPATSPPSFDQHLVLGISLGGHSTWQTLFTNPAVTAGVSIIGCPDFQLLMQDRARLSKRASYTATTATAGGGDDQQGASLLTLSSSFLGSRDFPPALIAQCAQFDPRAIVFGTAPIMEAQQQQQQQQPADNKNNDNNDNQQEETHARLRQVLDRCVRGKRFLLCTGGDDKLVPWRCSEPFTRFLVSAAEGWYRDGGLRVENKVYPGRGHECSEEMVVDAVRFLVGEVVGAAGGAGPGPAGARM